METLFGLPAVEVQPPRGKPVLYLFRARPIGPDRCRSWTVTKPDGTEYIVTEVLFDYWKCTCKDALYRRRFDRCKHVRAILKHLGREQ